MTKFERDMIEALEGNAREVIERRRAELKEIERQGRSCKNGFRRQCLAQEYVARKVELDEIEAAI